MGTRVQRFDATAWKGGVHVLLLQASGLAQAARWMYIAVQQ
jgi:hypothetical protein